MSYVPGKRADLVADTVTQIAGNTASRVQEMLHQLRALQHLVMVLWAPALAVLASMTRDNQQTFRPFESVWEFREYLYELAYKGYPSS